MPEDKKDETDVIEQIELEERGPKEDDQKESSGHDPYNNIPTDDELTAYPVSRS